MSPGSLPPRVLVADDEPDIVALVRILLDRAGYEVITASDGELALALAREHEPDLCVLDVAMPKLAGYEVLSQLRGADPTATIPVMIMTATVDDEREIRRHGVAPDSFIRKPFDSDRFLSEVARLIAR
jgi:DNA-binding response OmpR family regulator